MIPKTPLFLNIHFSTFWFPLLYKSISPELKQLLSELNLNALKHSLTEYLNQLIYSKTDRKPIVIPVFMPIET